MVSRAFPFGLPVGGIAGASSRLPCGGHLPVHSGSGETASEYRRAEAEGDSRRVAAFS